MTLNRISNANPEGLGAAGSDDVQAPSIHTGLSWIHVPLHRHSDVAIIADELCGKRGGEEQQRYTGQAKSTRQGKLLMFSLLLLLLLLLVILRTLVH